MPEPKRPALSDDARDYAQAINLDFDARLNAIAVEIAMANKCEFVLRPHVSEALLTLKRSGLKPPPPPLPWNHRPEFRIAAGSILLGLSPSVAGLAASLIGVPKDHPIYFSLFVVIVPIAMAVGGFCWAWSGWVQPPNTDSPT